MAHSNFDTVCPLNTLKEGLYECSLNGTVAYEIVVHPGNRVQITAPGGNTDCYWDGVANIVEITHQLSFSVDTCHLGGCHPDSGFSCTSFVNTNFHFLDDNCDEFGANTSPRSIPYECRFPEVEEVSAASGVVAGILIASAAAILVV